jgi:hypothetical protein
MDQLPLLYSSGVPQQRLTAAYASTRRRTVSLGWMALTWGVPVVRIEVVKRVNATWRAQARGLALGLRIL